MLDEILDNAVATSELLSRDLATSLDSKVNFGFSTSSSSSAAAAAAADRARVSRSTTLGYLLPQPKNHLAKINGAHGRSGLSGEVDPSLLHKLEEQNNLLPPQVRLVLLFVLRSAVLCY